MEIGKTIRAYRKKTGLTQEEVARRLGVTAPAVNKWENGSNLPDITLLAPLARLLGVSTDELLSFKGELTAAEVAQFIQKLDQTLRTQPFEKAFRMGKKQIEAYPACGELIWQTAILLEGRLLSHPAENAGQYDEAISGYFTRLLESDAMRTRGAEALFHFYMRRCEYAKAEEYLSYLPHESPEYKQKQAALYQKTGRRAQAYKAYEELLFAAYLNVQEVMSSLCALYLEDKQTDSARYIAEKMSAMAAAFDMGAYHEALLMLDVAADQKDKEQTLSIMQKLLSSIDTLQDFSRSRLYQHMHYQMQDPHFNERVRGDLLRSFKEDEAFAFLRGRDGWENLRASFHPKQDTV